MALPAPNTSVLEDGDEALLETPKDEQFDDLPAADEPEVLAERSAPAKQTAPARDDDDSDIPEQLRGKSAKELAKMYAEAQRVIGRQGQEVGELRGLADQFIRRQLSERAKPEKVAAEPVKDVDFFADPKSAIERAVADHPEVRRLREENESQKNAAETARRAAAEQAFNTKHPDAAEILGNEKFRAWVEGSKVRQALLRRAHQAYDVDAADEVFSTWKALNPAPKPEAVEAERAAQSQKRRAARVPTGGNAAPKDGNGAKIYRRADIIKLQINDPDRYEAMADEIERAYAEGRVR